MTCIVGIVDDGKVMLGGDSAGVAYMDLTSRADAKVFANGDFVFGFTSSFRMGQLLRYALAPPKRHPDKDVMAFMVGEFVDAVRACLKAGGFSKKDSEVETGGNFLVGYAGRLFNIGIDYQVAEAMCGYDACGCGDNIALGSLYTSAGMPAAERLKQALAAAEQHSAGVRGPFNFVLSSEPTP